MERRENLLEDHSVVDLAKEGTGQRTSGLFDYYLGYLTELRASPTTSRRFPTPRSRSLARGACGSQSRTCDGSSKQADRLGGDVVLGGHSLGGSITTAYATWDFNGKPGAEGLSGLVYIDGGSGTEPLTPEETSEALAELDAGSPWQVIGDIPAPFAGPVRRRRLDRRPHRPGPAERVSRLATRAREPRRRPVPVTNEALLGYGLDVDTSPPEVALAHAHLGHLAESGDPRHWDDAGALTPVQRYADMFSGTGLRGLDGAAWYHPLRLSIDAGAVAAGNPNPAQEILDVDAIHGADLRRGLRIYAFGASLGGQRVLEAASSLAAQSEIPKRNLTLVNREATYAHNDPNSAFPKNAFVSNLKRFLGGIAGP